MRHSFIFLSRVILLVIGVAAAPSFAVADATPPKAAIASAHPLATEAGHKILAAGGNAFDAAVAVAAVLAVVEPYSAGMGGGGFWLLHREKDQHQVMVDAREMAPGKAHRDMYLDSKGEVDRDKAINGPLAAGIPGQAAAFVHLAEKYGKLPLAQSLEPAIAAANDGFYAFSHYIRLAKFRKEVLSRYPASKNTFLIDGEVPTESDLIKQPDLANTLTVLGKEGFDGFYKGEVAKKMVDGVAATGGIWTLEDLTNYKIVERAPLIGEYHGAKVISVPPPSSGGVALITILNILEKYNLQEASQIQRIHLIAEAMRRAYKDRAEFLGDTDFVSVPIEKLISKAHAQKWGESIDTKKATPSASLGSPMQLQEGTHTTHLSVLDKEGNRVAATLSINLPFGSGYTAPGTGVLLNNEMDDFSSKPGSPNAYGLVGNEQNAIAPGKRPLSSMTPTFIETKDKVAILGTPGGSRIITMVLIGALEFFEEKPPIQWVSVPRFHHQYLPDVIQHEPNTFTTNGKAELTKMGHKLKDVGRHYGNMHAILWDKNSKQVQAASDPRGVGKASVK